MDNLLICDISMPKLIQQSIFNLIFRRIGVHKLLNSGQIGIFLFTTAGQYFIQLDGIQNIGYNFADLVRNFLRGWSKIHPILQPKVIWSWAGNEGIIIGMNFFLSLLADAAICVGGGGCV